MHEALRLSAGSRDPNAFTQAVNYIRGGGAPVPQNRLPAGFGPPAAEPPPGPFADPYEPSANGHGEY